jgi:TolB protein
VTRRRVGALAVAALLAPATAVPQFTNRYPRVEGFNHHIYLEGYELPVLNAGPSDPAVSPDGRRLALAARGWLWVVEIGERRARRLTRGAALDSRPAWAPDGRSLAFVRDDTRDTAIWGIAVGEDGRPGEERLLVDTGALDLDPCFAPDGRLLYSSAEAGDLDIWRLDPASGEAERLTRAPGLELAPQALPGGRLLYLTRQRSGDSGLVLREPDGAERILWRGDIASQLRPAVSRDGRRVAATLPGQERSRLMLLDTELPDAVHVAHRARLPLYPAFGPDGRDLYYVEADARQQFRLWRAPVLGGGAVDVTPLEWDWGVPTTRVAVRTRWSDSQAPLPVRLEVVDSTGHPLVSEAGAPRFDSQSGRVFQYSPGWLDLEAPVGETLRVEATHGFHARPASGGGEAGDPGPIDLRLEPLFDPAALDWYAGDLHWHLNYGGPWPLGVDDVMTELRAEALDVATPLVANLHTRFSDLELWDESRLGHGAPLVFFGQEVRAHFLGHVGLVGLPEPTWPWYWGPGYPAYARQDRPNLETLREAREAGAVTSYVHPVSTQEPFRAPGGSVPMPLALIPDALSGELDTLEIACLWSNERGTAEVWYRLLDLGRQVAPSAGTDAFPGFFRSMALGSARVYAHLPEGLGLPGYLDALRQGRSFVTTGPFLRLEVGGRGPGEVLDAAPGDAVPWTLKLDSVVPVETVELIAAGEVVWSGEGLAAPGGRELAGTLELPEAGWVAARAGGGEVRWPVMNAEVFAHTGPIWLGERGATTPRAAARAAAELLPVLDSAIRTLRSGYGDAPIPRLEAQFREARARLAERLR